jgi:hypothetical protein
VTVTANDGGTVTLDGELPLGDHAFLTRGSSAPSSGDPIAHLAGAPGFGFARVMVGEDGARMVPHFAAVDIASDNRLMPQTSFTSTHLFESPCESPVVEANLLYRSYPEWLAKQRGWDMSERVIAKAEK